MIPKVELKLDTGKEIKKGTIDITKKEELKRWSELLCCKEDDLIHAVLTIGNSAEIVDTFLYLNRKKDKQ